MEVYINRIKMSMFSKNIIKKTIKNRPCPLLILRILSSKIMQACAFSVHLAKSNENPFNYRQKSLK